MRPTPLRGSIALQLSNGGDQRIHLRGAEIVRAAGEAEQDAKAAFVFLRSFSRTRPGSALKVKLVGQWP